MQETVRGKVIVCSIKVAGLELITESVDPPGVSVVVVLEEAGVNVQFRMSCVS